MKKAGIVINPGKKKAALFLPQLRTWLEERVADVWLAESSPLEKIPEDTDLIICLGGDGTILSVARSLSRYDVPLLGVNLGSLGFLTEVKQDEVFEELESYLNGQSKIERRGMLECRVKSAAKGIDKTFIALNDIVISREGLTRLLRLEVNISGEKYTNFAGDGVIFATPTGSTAYSLSAGGAIVHPEVSAFIVTPICPHATAMRSMVISDSERIRASLEEDGGRTKAVLTADGQENLEIDDSFTVEVTCSKTPFLLVRSSKRGYFTNLRENFKFPE